jgi:hypothetical protein
MKTLFFALLKGYIAISSFFAMYFASLFWIGSKEEWEYQVGNHFWSFFGGRFFLVVIAGLIFFLLSLLLNWLFRKSVPYKKKYMFFEFFAVIIISILLVLKTIYWNG